MPSTAFALPAADTVLRLAIRPSVRAAWREFVVPGPLLEDLPPESLRELVQYCVVNGMTFTHKAGRPGLTLNVWDDGYCDVYPFREMH